MVYTNPEAPDEICDIDTTYDYKYLVMTISKGTESKNKVYIANFTDPEVKMLKGEIKFQKLIDEYIGAFSLLQTSGSKFYFDTNFDAPRGKVIEIDINKP